MPVVSSQTFKTLFPISPVKPVFNNHRELASQLVRRHETALWAISVREEEIAAVLTRHQLTPAQANAFFALFEIAMKSSLPLEIRLGRKLDLDLMARKAVELSRERPHAFDPRNFCSFRLCPFVDWIITNLDLHDTITLKDGKKYAIRELMDDTRYDLFYKVEGTTNKGGFLISLDKKVERMSVGGLTFPGEMTVIELRHYDPQSRISVYEVIGDEYDLEMQRARREGVKPLCRLDSPPGNFGATTLTGNYAWAETFEPQRVTFVNLLKARGDQLNTLGHKLRGIKIIVIDLDNTLWGGLIGDAGRSGIVLGGSSREGAYFKEFQTQLRALKEKGYLLAISSKNDETVVMDALQNHPEMALREEAFVAVMANWGDKSANMAALAQELNLGLDSFLFIDDNPRERGLVREKLPQVKVLDPCEFTPALQFLQETSLAVTQEDRMRTQFYLAKKARTSFLQTGCDPTTLGIKLSIKEADESELNRISQMSQRTNQFNACGSRYTIEDLRKIMLSCDKTIYTLHYRDKFGDEGLVGVIIVAASRAEPRAGDENKIAQIRDFFLSCRIFGYGVEEAFFRTIANLYEEYGYRSVTVDYKATDRNAMVAKFYRGLGFPLSGYSPIAVHKFTGKETTPGIEIAFDGKEVSGRQSIVEAMRNFDELVEGGNFAVTKVLTAEQAKALQEKRKRILSVLDETNPFIHGTTCFCGDVFEIEELAVKFLEYSRKLVETDRQLQRSGTAGYPDFRAHENDRQILMELQKQSKFSGSAVYAAYVVAMAAWEEKHPSLAPDLLKWEMYNSVIPYNYEYISVGFLWQIGRLIKEGVSPDRLEKAINLVSLLIGQAGRSNFFGMSMKNTFDKILNKRPFSWTWAGHLTVLTIDRAAGTDSDLVNFQIALAPDNVDLSGGWHRRISGHIRHSIDGGPWSTACSDLAVPNLFPFDRSGSLRRDPDGNILLQGEFKIPKNRGRGFEWTMYVVDHEAYELLWAQRYGQGNLLIAH